MYRRRSAPSGDPRQERSLGSIVTSAAVAVTVSAPALALTAPANGAALSGDSVLVKGSFGHPGNVGITVNGVVAVIDANHNFYVTVPLVPGVHPIIATLTTQAGQTATQGITVSSDGVAPAIRIGADVVEGTGSLTVNFSIDGIDLWEEPFEDYCGDLSPGQFSPDRTADQLRAATGHHDRHGLHIGLGQQAFLRAAARIGKRAHLPRIELGAAG